MKLYQADIPIWATAYVRANSPEEAKAKIIAAAKDRAFEFEEDDDEELPISGKSFDDPELPDVSLSPAMSTGSDEEMNQIIVTESE